MNPMRQVAQINENMHQMDQVHVRKCIESNQKLIKDVKNIDRNGG